MAYDAALSPLFLPSKWQTRVITPVITPVEVYADIQQFIEALETLPFEPKDIGLTVGKNEVLNIYRRIYRLGAELP